MILKFLNDKVDSSEIDNMVFEMNSVFGTEYLNDNNTEVMEGKLNTQLHNVYDEVIELIDDGILSNNINEVYDALGDILTFALGGLYMFNSNYESVFIETKTYVDTEAKDLTLLLNQALKYKEQLENASATVEWFNEMASFGIQWSNALNYDIDSLMKSVTKSNYTKLCTSSKELEATLEAYKNRGVEDLYSREFDINIDNQEHKYYVVYSGSNQTDVNGKVYRKDKFLKSVNFKEPVLNVRV